MSDSTQLQLENALLKNALLCFMGFNKHLGLGGKCQESFVIVCSQGEVKEKKLVKEITNLVESSVARYDTEEEAVESIHNTTIVIIDEKVGVLKPKDIKLFSVIDCVPHSFEFDILSKVDSLFEEKRKQKENAKETRK